jgi:hypothetical protein
MHRKSRAFRSQWSPAQGPEVGENRHPFREPVGSLTTTFQVQNIAPINPVIQGVEPELRLLLGLLAQLPPQFREFPGQHDARLDRRPFRRLIGAGRPRFRSGIGIQAVLLTLAETTFSAGPLGSPGVTRLRSYYEPHRLPTRSGDGYAFPPRVGRSTHPVGSHLAGPPRFLIDLSTPAVRSHPGEPGRCVCSLLRGRRQASPFLEGWPFPNN